MFESYFGLSAQPFQLSPDPAFFYASRGHKRAYAYLQYGLYQGEGFIALTGEVGAGKTTLIRSLLQEVRSKNVVIAAQLVSTQLDEDNLLRAVATAFGIAVRGEDKATLLAELEAYLVSLVTQNQRAVLIVDEAQNLTPRALEELRMLSNFQLQNRALLQSFLVGQPELRELLRSPAMRQLRQRVIASYHLAPLDSDETRAYIEHRLKQVGWKGDPEFDDEVFALLHAYSGGIPRRLNTACTRALLAAFLTEQRVISVETVEQVIGELSDELGDTPAAAAVAGASCAGHLALEDRISGIEKALAMTLKLLREALRIRAPAEAKKVS